jgi:hypothetical protein
MFGAPATAGASCRANQRVIRASEACYAHYPPVKGRCCRDACREGAAGPQDPTRGHGILRSWRGELGGNDRSATGGSGSHGHAGYGPPGPVRRQDTAS